MISGKCRIAENTSAVTASYKKKHFDLTITTLNAFNLTAARSGGGNSVHLLWSLYALLPQQWSNAASPQAPLWEGPSCSSGLLLPARVGRKKPRREGTCTCMNTASLWPGGWWWCLAFIDFCYFSDKHPPLCLATEGGKRSEQRGVFGVSRERRKKPSALLGLGNLCLLILLSPLSVLPPES